MTNPYNGKRVYTPDNFSFDRVKVGDYVSAGVVMNCMNELPPACMELNCAQIGEPHSSRKNPATGKWRTTYETFKCVEGDFIKGVWEYCGDCFRGENEKRGEEMPYISATSA